MKRLTDNKIILVRRATRLEDLLVRFNTAQQARFYVEHLGADFSDYEAEHKVYHAALAEAEATLKGLGRVQVLDRAFLTNFIFGASDTVVVLGQDGLVANTLKYLKGHPVVAVNPDPARWEGVLLPFKVADLRAVVAEVFEGKRRRREITMAMASLSDGQRLYGVNDLFIGHRSHVSARYEISLGEASERQSSSGIIVSTGLGSTGWLRSCLAGARAIAGAMDMKGGRNKGGKGHKGLEQGGMDRIPDLTWESECLYYTVREPWPSKTTSANLVFGRIEGKERLTVVSGMPERGVIFSDGIEADALEFNSGVEATITVADKKGLLVV